MISRKAAEEKFSRGGAGTRRIKQAGVVYEPYDYWRASAPIPILRNYRHWGSTSASPREQNSAFRSLCVRKLVAIDVSRRETVVR
jgi:hypothetical protein